jgi:hypothetical protein
MPKVKSKILVLNLINYIKLNILNINLLKIKSLILLKAF